VNATHRISPRIAAHRRASPRIAAHRRASPRIAAHRDHRCKKSVAEIAPALRADWKVEQLFTLRHPLAAWR